MIKSGERVVVVAGAGCSAEFGLPTGIGLMRRLHSEALQESPTSGLSFADIFRRPFLEVFPSAYENKFNGRDVLEFLREAKNLYADSIDLFAFNHPSKAEVCKAYSTLGIMRGLYSETSVQDRFGDTSNYFELAYKWRKPLVSAGNSSRPNWLASLARKYTEGKTGPEQLDPDALQIVTFNYDPIIEDALKFFVGKTERFRDAAETQLPRVHHIYGSFPRMSARLDNYSFFSQNADAIKYINDLPRPNPDSAREAINRATQIYIIGFDMDPMNVELIGLAQAPATKCALAYDGNIRLIARLKNVGVVDKLLLQGTEAQPLSIGHASQQGFFDLASL